ncbi:uncharacterized protein LOC105698153 isoform X2 [Orussus abietinus]|nr:uncharacterized protein LOC105698153 isoform X2 [Orussus abietinus]XP_012277580.1 uncharacterized protein LOC105698153 isoform X2 [Orussus abietinus]XP_012277581.1 uncharacterized protein LOC105698153 isoform X2 [Orussus abietinus]XP_012277582.1 uncharacterized protein LOC105698153 isoform X2 [Orussus abietinus]
MAPTICLSELPVTRGSSSPYTRRRLKTHNGGIGKRQQHHQRADIKQILNAPSEDSIPAPPSENFLWDPQFATDSCTPVVLNSSQNSTARVPKDPQEYWKTIITRREGLLNIVSRTMALVRRNQILQKRVNALRAETQDFIQSVLSNPENKQCQENKEAPSKESVVSSTTDEVSTTPTSPPTSDSMNTLTNCVTSTSSSSEFDSDTSMDYASDDSENSKL